MTLSLTVKDWNGSHVAELSDVPADTTVGEVVEEVTEAMNLPRHTPYALVDRRARKLPHSFTLAEAGLENGEEVQVAADVRAGSGRGPRSTAR